MTGGYAELQVTTNFSFLRGASHPEELVEQAKAEGLSGLAITDRNSLAGVVRAQVAAKAAGLPLIVGCRLDLIEPQRSLLCFPRDRAAYGRLCRLLTLGKRRAEKGGCHLTHEDLLQHAEGQILIALGDHPDADLRDWLASLRRDIGGGLYLALTAASGRGRWSGWRPWTPWGGTLLSRASSPTTSSITRPIGAFSRTS